MDNDTIKRKNDLMRTILGNPKLSQTFREAMSAPIGSTKRQQAKSVLSVMKKVGGVKNDGQGGMLSDIGSSISSGFSNMFGTNTKTSTPPTAPDYSNVLIFPAAPKLKTKSSTPSIIANMQPGGQSTEPNQSYAPTVNYSSNQTNSTVNKNPFTSTKIATQPVQSTPALNYTPISSPREKIMSEPLSVPSQPINPGLKQIFSPSNLWSGVKKVTGAIGSAVRPIANVAASLPGAAIATIPAAASLFESAARNIPKLYSGWNPGELVNPTETESWKLAQAFTSKSPWIEDWAKARNEKATPSSTPVTGAGFTVKDSGTTNTSAPTTEVMGTQTQMETPQNNTTSGFGSQYPTLSKGVVTPTGSTSSSTSNGTNIAANSVAKILGTSANAALSEIDVVKLAEAIATNEGYFNGTSKVAIANNNPGNLKFVGQPGATKDARGFAVFKTPEEGAQALINDLTYKYNSGKYSTINDLMSVYSPDFDNPANPNYGKTGPTLATSGAQAYVDNNLGSYALGEDMAQSRFGGRTLDQVITDIDTQLKKDYNLEPLELELTNLKAQGKNLIPTLQTFMSGKDQYLKFVDSMIEQTENELLSKDMADPVVANSYNKQLNYLYTLKGRQNQRYGNFLNSAIADYNADLTRVQDNYNNVYKQYQNALTSKGTIAQTEYNNLMTRGAALYTELENAPIKKMNAQILEEQLIASRAANLANGVTQATNTNPKYWEDVADYTNQITFKDGDQKGALDPAKVGTDGLISLYAQNNIKGGDQRAMTEAIRIALVKAIESGGNDPKVIANAKNMIDTLRNSGYAESAVWADALANSIIPSAQTNLTKYILPNISNIKKAATSLVKGGLWSKPGIEDKESWMKDNSGLDKNFLENLYNMISINIGQGTAYEKNPVEYVNRIFSGATNEENAKNLADRMALI